ncbi:MAG: DUF1015 domain-containing protein [Clostridia bacterium]|nr:DUF1015 domain-containing protein [Clostridia bacterium]
MDFKKCFTPADFLLPEKDFDKWAVIACDQYTSEPEYWQRVKDNVGNSPSALNCILPEVYLEEDNSRAIEKINKTMEQYRSDNVFSEVKDSFIFVERTQSDGRKRLGIVGKIDLECYDFIPGTTAAVRATEQTVLSRIPPRVEIRKNAPLELPHVMLLIDDPEDLVMGILKESSEDLDKLYDFSLMENGGDIKGYKVDKARAEQIEEALQKLAERNNGLLFCVGDGNHSLATAKKCYEQSGSELSRYAAVEVVNIHDSALEFEPIYRVVFGANPEKIIDDFVKYCGGESKSADAKTYTCVYGDKLREIRISSKEKLAVATLQNFLDEYLKGSSAEVDYIHGEESVKKLCKQKNTVGFIFDGMGKSELFAAVYQDGSLPRKTFSMGHADDKRFYIEARKIK